MALRSLGNQLRLLGQLEASERILQASLDTSELDRDRSLAYLSLGNTLKAKVNRAFNLRQFDLGDDDNLIQASSLDSYAMTALGYYQRAIDLSSSPSLRLQGQLNRLDILSDLIRIIPQKAEYLQNQLDFELIVIRLNPLANNYQQQIDISSSQVEQFTQEAEQLIDQIYPQLSSLPLSNIKVESQLKLACHSIDCNQINLQKSTNNLGLNQESVLNLIQESITEAEQLGSLELQSYGYGVLGKFQEKSQNWDEAITATRNALALSTQGVRQDLSYQWQWQMGRILQTRHEENLGVADVSIEAIHSYRQASQILKQLRQDLATLDSRVQYDFRDNVEPVYKQFVELLLRGDNVSTESLEEARNAIEDLRIAELNNFFQDACITEEEVEVDDIIDKQDPTAALIYTIILDDTLEVIAKLPGQDLSHHSVTQNEQGYFQKVLWNLYLGLIDVAKNHTDVKPNAQEMYEWLIAPLSPKLEESNVKTLVFFLDTILQRIPMSVLYNQDTDKFLIEDYAIAITPGIKIIQPQSFDTVGVSVLGGGLSGSRENLPELPGVEREIEDISQLLPTRVLLNQTFTRSAVENLVGSGLFSVIHLATHGNFSSDPERTYLVLSDELLKVRSMDAVFRLNPLATANVIELLVMSACKTAKGDERAALGLSGMAVRSGARSTVATLWPADDESTAKVMPDFYEQLKAGKNKAEALRSAQLNFLNQLRYEDVENPEMEFRVWAPYILVGNWL
jgi:CHAT domain-containing protein